MKKAEQTIRVSTETEKCFVTIKEFRKRIRDGEFPHLVKKYFGEFASHYDSSYAPSATSIRNRIIKRPAKIQTKRGYYGYYTYDPATAILKQKNSSKHWEIDLISSRKEEKRLRTESAAWRYVRKLPQIQELRRVEEAQREQLEALRGRIESLSQEQFDIRTNAQPQS